MSCKLNDIECFISKYTVQISANADDPAVLDAVIVDACNTLRRPCDAQKILLKAVQDYLDSVDAGESVYADCTSFRSACPGLADGIDFYYGDRRITVPTAATVPTAPVMGEVPLPFKCEVPVVFA